MERTIGFGLGSDRRVPAPRPVRLLRGWSAAAIAIVAALVVLGEIAEPPAAPSPVPTIEDWRGNSARIVPLD